MEHQCLMCYDNHLSCHELLQSGGPEKYWMIYHKLLYESSRSLPYHIHRSLVAVVHPHLQ